MQKADEASFGKRENVARAKEQQGPGAAKRKYSADKLDGLRVLVVDDEPDSRLMMEFFFRLRHATVRVAASASEGRRVLEAFKPDLIVSDIAMPTEDGNQFLRSIRALPVERGGAIPAIALTAFIYPEDRRRALDAGFNIHLGKPAEHEELLQAVHSLVGPSP